jgi:type VI secretion system secreted protein VgrG
MSNETHLITLESDDFEAARLEVARLTGRERINALFDFRIDAVARSENAIDPASMRGATIAIVFSRGSAEVRRIWGVVTEVDDHLTTSAKHRSYGLRIEPRAHALGLVRVQDLYLETSLPEIFVEKLRRLGLDADTELRLSESYPKRELVMQYEETDLAFISRHAEHLGISFLFEHGDSDRIVFVDANAGFPLLEGGDTVPFQPSGDRVDVFELTRKLVTTPNHYTVSDYNYRTPTVDLTGAVAVEDGLGGGIVEYGAHYKTPDEGRRLARIRAEELRATQDVFRGQSTRIELSAGRRFTIESHPHLGDLELLVTEVEHHASLPAFGNDEPGADQGYHNRFVAIPADRAYRPPRVTPRPHMAGVYNAFVQPKERNRVAASADLDEAGRYRLRFLFDLAERQGFSSRPIRMAQPHSGAGHGFHFPLRPGVEVLVAFANGDPDRPLILGAVDNPVTPSPTTRANHRENNITTATGIRITLRDSS